MVEPIEAIFPGLRCSSYRVTSPPTRDYNCIGWAAGDANNWWWPDIDPDNDAIYWPAGVVMEETLDACVAAFATVGYALCTSADFEPGFEKIALFAHGTVPTHAARQLANGRWTSKLGFAVDIEHDLQAVCGEVYGKVSLILRRPRPQSGS
jgi:hypothetical protein